MQFIELVREDGQRIAINTSDIVLMTDHLTEESNWASTILLRNGYQCVVQEDVTSILLELKGVSDDINAE